MKRFDSPEQYAEEIRRLVPGYPLIQEVLPAIALSYGASEETRTLCVGVGTGVEAELLLRTKERNTLVAIDPSEQMCEETRRRLVSGGLGERAKVVQARLEEFRCEEPFDLVVMILVAHFVADQGARSRLFFDVARCLAPEGRVLIVEISALESREQLHAYERWATQRGLSAAGVQTLRKRLTSEFHTISGARFAELAGRAGLEVETEFLRVLNVVGYVLRHRTIRG